MLCPQCGWNNPASYTHCFSCHTPLSASAGIPAPDTPDPSADAPVYPGWGAFIAASLIDLVLMIAGAVILVILVYACYRQAPADFAGSTAGILIVVGAAGFALLLPAVLDSLAGGSIGNRLAGIRIVNRHGQAPGLLRSLLRHVVKYTAHSLLPLIFRFFEGLIFPGHSLHNLVSQTWAVSRRASPVAIQAAIDADTKAHTTGKILAIVLAGLFGTLLAGIGYLVIERALEPPNPRRDAARQVVIAGESLTRLSGNHFAQTGQFATSATELGLSQLPEGIAKVRFNARNGSIIVYASPPEIMGKRLVFYPEIKRSKTPSAPKWHCGSPDQVEADRPTSCRESVTAFLP